MLHFRGGSIGLLAGVSLLALVLTQCGGSDGPATPSGPFEGGFLGLANVERNVTQCGECHESQQAKWEQTPHAEAYATLEAIGRESPDNSCAFCHNVSDRGSPFEDDTVGYPNQPNARLRNVQCENCHGPGSDHLADRTNEPEAPLEVSFDIGCGECHQDAHHPFVDEWSTSAHAESHLSGASFGLNVAGNPDCAYCHVAQSFITFVESGGTEQTITADPLPITCVGCHDPHGNGNDKQVRIVGDEPIVCAQCHTSEGAIPGDTPHHPQAEVLLATGAFFFPAGVTNPGPATHGNLETNPDLCAGCHLAQRDYQRGEVPIPAQVGHTFLAVPVVDEATGERNFDDCVECHSSPEPLLDTHQARVTRLLAELEAALEAVPEGQRSGRVYDGVLFNFEVLEADGSHGVHNPRLTIQLLEGSIAAL